MYCTLTGIQIFSTMKNKVDSKLDQFKEVSIAKEDQKKIKGGTDGTTANDFIIIDSVDL